MKKTDFKPEQYLHRGILSKWHDKSFDDFDNDEVALRQVKAYLKNCKKARTNGTGLYLYGAYGTGKTLLLNCLLKQIMQLGYTVKVITLGTLVANFAQGWYDEEKRQEFIRMTQTVDFLAIDDLGKEFKGSSDLGLRVFDNIIRYRLQSKLPILFTANITPQEIKAYYSEGVASMLNEMCALIKVTGQDIRKNVIADNNEKILK